MIDAKRYNEEHRKIGSFSNDLSMRVTDACDDGNHDEIAIDYLLESVGGEAPAAESGSDDRIKSADEE